MQHSEGVLHVSKHALLNDNIHNHIIYAYMHLVNMKLHNLFLSVGITLFIIFHQQIATLHCDVEIPAGSFNGNKTIRTVTFFYFGGKLF